MNWENFYFFWCRATPFVELCLLCLGFVPVACAWRSSRYSSFYFLVTVITVACTAPYAYCFAPVFACCPILALGIASLQLVRSSKSDDVGVPAWQQAFAWCVVLATAAVFWAEYRHDLPSGVQLRAPLGGAVAVRQGGVSAMFNSHIPAKTQRWAIDLMRPWSFSDLGAHLLGRPELGSSFGSSVYAPCDAEVLVTWDDLPDQPIGRTHPTIAPGNIIVLRCNDTSPAAVVRLGHLRQGPVRVARGAHVAVGDLLAEVGNTGNTSMPHLHMDAQTVVAGGTEAGLPLPMYLDGHFPRALQALYFAPPAPGTEPVPTTTSAGR